MKTKELLKKVKAVKVRGAWETAVKDDAIDFCDQLIKDFDVQEINRKNLERILLNGAPNWKEYSWGGYGLIYDYDIAKHYCSPSELKMVTLKNGEIRRPNKREEWLDVQARGLFQAYIMLRDLLND